MKGKIIRAFLAVYLAVSMVYGGVRAAYLTVMAALEPPETAGEQIELSSPASFGVDTVPAEPERPETVTLSPAVSPSEPPSPSPEPSALSGMAEPAEEPAMEKPSSPQEPSDAEESAQMDAEPAEDSVWEEAPEPMEESPELTETPAEEPDEEQAYLEAAPAEDIPSLEDYLSGLHCGRCGRNCFLSSPRCRTGRNKAENAAAEYYAEYGAALT